MNLKEKVCDKAGHSKTYFEDKTGYLYCSRCGYWVGDSFQVGYPKEKIIVDWNGQIIKLPFEAPLYD